MYAYIKGEITGLAEEGVVLECGGIGYHIQVPVPPGRSYFEIGEEVKIYTYLSVTENAMKLYGFLSSQDVALFKNLISVNGIGPKGALNILSAMTADELRIAILTQNEKKITEANGIGKKSAQRLILELKDKFHADGLSDAIALSNDSLPEGMAEETKNGNADAQFFADVAEALTVLGYSASQIKPVIKQLQPEYDSLETAIKEALNLL